MKDVAIATYIDNVPNLIIEFGWLYKSWLYSGSWVTSEIVAFYNPIIDTGLLPRDGGVIYIPLTPITESHKEWDRYKFINSVWFLTTKEATELLKYKYVLRTDCDCFLTPYFSSLRPRLAAFGAGMFADDSSVVIKLAEVAKRWGIYPSFNNVGSTLMATSEQVLQYSHVHFEYCRKLGLEEFQNGPGKWPGWYIGVLSMYAGQLAAMSYFQNGLTIGGLDLHCMAETEMCNTDYHIHAWHTWQYFSKLRWRKGEYKDVDLSTLNKNSIADYCLWIANL
jgi:hypothetical protein